MKTICLFGATGNIGMQSITSIKNNQQIKLQCISFYKNIVEAKQIIKNFSSLKYLICDHQDNAITIKKLYPHLLIFNNFNDFFSYLKQKQITFDYIINAINGYVGFNYTYKAIPFTKKLILANKESLVMAGDFIIQKALKWNCQILPLDSEHFCLYSLLENNTSNYQKLIITCSGGPVYKNKEIKLADLTYQQIINHPTWDMGQHINVNSATLINKCFEVIEAKYLFEPDINKIDVVLHPQSIIHAGLMHENNMASWLASPAQMSYAIDYYLKTPSSNVENKWYNNSPYLEILPMEIHPLFHIFLLYKKIFNNNVYAIILNVINDFLVNKFLLQEINFLDLISNLEHLFDQFCLLYQNFKITKIDQIFELITDINNQLNSKKLKSEYLK